MQINSIVLSAGKGTRMCSELPKVVQPVLGYEMINHVLKNLSLAEVENNVVVVGYQKDVVLNRIDSQFKIEHVEQTEQLGTAHAVMMAKEKLENKDGITIVTCGDTPLIEAETFKALIDFHLKEECDLTVLTTEMQNPFGYGRIVRADGGVKAIIEQKDASSEVQAINEVNTGVYCFDNQKLFKYLKEVKNENSQTEYYLTDLVSIFKNNNEKVNGFMISDSEQVTGVNDLIALEQVNNILKLRINRQHMLNGVQIIDANNTYIGPNVQIGKGVTIYPGNTILGDSVIGENTILQPNNTIDSSTVGNNTTIGPMAYLRNNARVGNECRVGNFVEIKNSTLGNKTKAAHLTYIGDAKVGENVNFGCGTITANYDGKSKFKTVIGNNVFIGSNVNLIAPVEIQDDSFIAAGTTVTKNIEKNKFVIDRNELRIKNKK